MATIEIVGAAEVAEILGIGNTNFSHLRKQRAGTDDAFPDPIVVLKCGPIWKKSDAVKYAKSYAARRRHIPAPAEKAEKTNGTAVVAKNTPAAKKVASTPKAATTKAAAAPAPSKKVVRKLPAKKAPVKKLALAR